MLSLFQFQETAATNVASRVSEYLDAPQVQVVNRQRHVVPFFHALSALTGAGKTAILAQSVTEIAATMSVKPIVMWLSKGKVVVQQTVENLSPGGKYHHLLDSASVDMLGNYRPETAADLPSTLVFFATVGTFNQRDKDGSTLLVHKSDVDNMESSIWDALKLRLDARGNRRPLVVVYDEAQNLSNQQTDLLLELEPDGFLMASATMRVPARIGEEIERIRTAGYGDEYLVTKVKTKDVVAEALVKDTVLLGGYNTPMEEAVSLLLDDMRDATQEASALGLPFTPKAIYVCNTNVVADTPSEIDSPRAPFDQRQAPPILIWRYLVESKGIDPRTIAVYSDLKTDKDFPLPDEFVLYRGGDRDYDDFTAGSYSHIIFNLSLQEGWDDPSVYFAYIDKSMESPVQITQVIGRVLRQPDATRYPSERLNSAHFYVRVDRNSVFNDVVTEVRKQLGGDQGGIKVVVTPPGKERPVSEPPRTTLTVPETGLNAALAHLKAQELQSSFPDFRLDKVNTRGTGSRRVLRQVVGAAATESDWEEYEHSAEASARWVLLREVQRQLRAARGLIDLVDPKLDAIVGIGSSAHRQVLEHANRIVDTYVSGVQLSQRRLNPYTVGPTMVRADDAVPYQHAAHSRYSDLSPIERKFADAVDKLGVKWARNPSRSGYGIPLVTVGPTSTFYPDFLIWTDQRLICVDTKGPHLVDHTARRKLLTISARDQQPRLVVEFVSEGRFDSDLSQRDSDGYTFWGRGSDGALNAVHFEELDQVVSFLVEDANF